MLKIFTISFSILLFNVNAISQNKQTQTFLNLVDSAQFETNQNNWSKALPLWENITQQNNVNAEYWYNLATARFETRNYTNAIPAFLKARELGFETPGERDLDIARCYAAKENRDSTYHWLSKSLTEGFPDMNQLHEDSILKKYYADERFVNLLWMKDLKKMNRVQGWTYDVDYLNWQIKRLHPNPYLRYSPQAYEKEIQQIKKRIPNATDVEITAALVKLIAMVPDAHSRIYGFFENKDLRYFIPLFFEFFKEGLFVTEVDPQHKELLGKRIDSIDGKSINKIMSVLIPYLNYDNGMWFKNSSLVRLMNPAFLHAIGICKKPDRLTLSYSDSMGNKSSQTILSAEREAGAILDWIIPDNYLSIYAYHYKIPLRRQNSDRSIWMQFLPDNKVMYVKFNRVYDNHDESLSDFGKRLSDSLNLLPVKKLIIDLRDNSGGNTYLLPGLLNAISGSTKINQKGKLFCLIGRNTYSAAQNFATYLEKFTNVIFIGEPTGSNPNFIGETKRFTLPFSKLQANISNLYWQSSYPTDHRIWIAPELFIEPSFYSTIHGMDNALDPVLN